MLIEDLHVVLKVAECKSITAAASQLDMRTATASAALKRVENALGFELFIRTTRQLRLSTAGERYIPQCEQALSMLEQAGQNMKDDLDIIEGELRIAISSDLGRNLVIPWLDEFMETYPDIRLKVYISDSNIDLYRDNIDMALRYGSAEDTNLYGFKICDAPIMLCASPEYLEKNSTPENPENLKSHNGLFYQLYDITHDVWTFTHNHADYKIKMKGNRASNDGDLVRRWCTTGKGLAIKSCIDMSNELLSGQVVNIMPEYKPASTELWLICPSKQSITPAVRLLRDMFKTKTRSIFDKLISAGVLAENIERD